MRPCIIQALFIIILVSYSRKIMWLMVFEIILSFDFYIDLENTISRGYNICVKGKTIGPRTNLKVFFMPLKQRFSFC